jgi:hypothetical protein
LLSLLSLLSLAPQAGAQTGSKAELPERPVAILLRPYDSAEWPRVPVDGTQTSFRIRHNAADGTVVGMSLQQSRYPAFLLQLELVPPGQLSAKAEPETPSPADPPGNEPFRRIHKLSLRYHF